MKKIPVSVVVLTKNEEQRIFQCLDSVDWAAEIIVVDDESADQTVEIARRYTDRIIVKKMDIQGRHRNWAHAQATYCWILSLDADEVVTPELREEIAEVMGRDVVESGFTIPRRNYIGDYWVKHGGWYPSGQLKLFRKDRFRWEEAEVHCRAFLDGSCGHLKSDIIHYSYRNLEDFLAKLNRQSSWEAKKWFNQGKSMKLGRFLWRAFDRSFRSYFIKKGYKDGFMGFVVAFYAALYQVISYLKYREMVLKGGGVGNNRSIVSRGS